MSMADRSRAFIYLFIIYIIHMVHMGKNEKSNIKK